MAYRGFIAVDLVPSRSLSDVMQELRTSGASLKLVPAEQFHATLKFLGDTEDGLTGEIVGIMRKACEGHPPFRATLRGTGAFPGLSRMNVLWVGIEGAQPLVDIAARLETSLAPLGFRPEERRWSAHATVARVRGGGLDRVRQILRAHANDSFGEVLVDRVRLKRSALTPQGPVYTTVAEVPL
ncbi:MAG: RNA 2',3'-cyclic phosphodiesterase [Methanobacteriota archaeon]